MDLPGCATKIDSPDEDGNGEVRVDPIRLILRNSKVSL